MQKFQIIAALLLHCAVGNCQEVPIQKYERNANDQAQLTVASTDQFYYVLHVRHSPTGAFEQATSIVFGKNGSTILTEPLAAYPIENYRVTEHPISQPADTDGDGVDDLTELKNSPAQSPFNTAPPIDWQDGITFLPDQQTFKKIAEPNLDILEVKFYLRYRDSDEPKIYFVNSKTHALHTGFAAAIGYHNDGTLMTGSIIFHPSAAAPNGSLGVYRFFFQPNNAFSFALVQKAMELMAANMPFLKNNLCYYPLEQAALPLYFQEKKQYDDSRVSILLADDLFAQTDYLALHPAEGFGLLRVMNLGDFPASRDVVLYEALPNELPRVGGIITTVMQTPLSHVNLRAIQDNVPNAFIRNALQNVEIAALVGKHVFYKVEQGKFTLREASKEEVDNFYEKIRPTKKQTPVRDLTKTKIEPLDSIRFEESASFGVKCANVATMRRFGFPDGTIPQGFGLPFYFYDEFMKFNAFYSEAKTMLAAADFQSNFEVQIQRLEDFRKKIKAAPMPQWMLDELETMQNAFPPDTPIRCRSSTNNEDLPGFSGAGLYDSKTHKPDEGHLQKTVKQVFASIWNFRAFDEREFYRVDHFAAAMGVLVHPNFEHERANGVGVSTDPIYQSDGTFYLNTQVGEDLVTNPNALSIPEEILLDEVAAPEHDFVVINPSNQVAPDSLILQKNHLGQLREWLGVIHREFQKLYKAEAEPNFAMEIEYKITAEGQLSIKQARPWANFWAKKSEPSDSSLTKIGLKTFPNPFRNLLNVDCSCKTELQIEVFNFFGQRVGSELVDFRRDFRQLSLGHLDSGIYFLRGSDAGGLLYFSEKLVKIR